MKRPMSNGEAGFPNRRSRLAAIALILSSVAAAPCWASYSCSGTISSVSLSPTGLVVVSSSAGFSSVEVCTVGSSSNGVTSDVCKAIVALLISAKINSSTVVWTFTDSLTCSTHPAWNWLTGWSNGPMVQ
jgi:hypothetical protein